MRCVKMKMKMKKKIMLIAMLSLAISAMIGCSNEKEEPKETKKPVVEQKETKKEAEKETSKEEQLKAIKAEAEEVVRNNAKFAEEENFEKYMETLGEAANTEDSKKSVELLFKNYDIDYEVIEISVLSATESEAKVQVKQKALGNNPSGEFPFQNHIATAVHTLKKENGKFKFVDTKVVETQLLDVDGKPVDNTGKSEEGN